MAYVTSITLNGKRIGIDERVPRYSVEWLIERVHVATTDDDIRADMAKRCSTNPAFTPALIRQTQAYAIWWHRKNQNLVSQFRL